MGKIGFILIAILVIGLNLYNVKSEPFEDKQALLDFIQQARRSRFLNWNPTTPMCITWTGVTCNVNQTQVTALRLPGFGFHGSIPPNTLSRLSGLQTLSLRRNRFSGPFPSDFSKLGNLKSLYLQSNMFTGPLPLNFSFWQKLVVLNLSYNHFNGSIPSSISSMKNLTTLDLRNNSLSGQIPDFDLPNLKYLNLSTNQLNGTLPPSLLRFPRSSFSGNNITYVVALPPLPSAPAPVSQPQHKSNKKLGETALLGIVLGGSAILFVAIALMILVLCQNNGSKYISKTKRAPGEIREEKNGKMTFFEGSKLAFDLEDLLRASAEVLGKGAFGTTYKASLEDTTTVVVKRLKETSVGKREFEQLMEVVGNIKHENVAALRAYYYSKDEKLMVYDYFSQGNLSTILHGKRGEDPNPLDWETRVRIAIGTARGMAHIHTQNGGKLVHGNIKSSNIFLDPETNHGCVSDLGLATIITPITPPINRIIGYRAPEVTDPRKATQPSDVYSFGVLLLELLTGKSPLMEGVDLVKWVYSVVKEEWTAEVFDTELLRYPNIEEEMVAMLQVGMACAEQVPDRRPKMWEVVRMVEDIRRGNTGTRPSSEVSTPASLSHMVDIGSTSTPQ